jgi:hypothetical protein
VLSQVGERAAPDFLVNLGQLAAHRRLPHGAEGRLQIEQRRPEAMRHFEEDQRRRFAGMRFEETAALGALPGEVSEE